PDFAHFASFAVSFLPSCFPQSHLFSPSWRLGVLAMIPLFLTFALSHSDGRRAAGRRARLPRPAPPVGVPSRLQSEISNFKSEIPDRRPAANRTPRGWVRFVTGAFRFSPRPSP